MGDLNSQPQENKTPAFTVKPVYIILLIIIILIVGGKFYFASNPLNPSKQQDSSSTNKISKENPFKEVKSFIPPISVIPISEFENSPGLKVYQQPKPDVLALKGFKIYYPKSWVLTLNKIDKTLTLPATTLVKMKKGNSEITISQNQTKTSDCFYPGDNADGKPGKFGEFKEINKGNNIIWRRAKFEGSTDYLVCQKRPTDTVFNSTTSIGVIDLNLPSDDPQTLSEFDEILSKIEF